MTPERAQSVRCARLPSRQSAASAAARRLETDARTVTDLKGESLINEHNGGGGGRRGTDKPLFKFAQQPKLTSERALLFNTAAAGAAAADFPGRKPSEIARVNVCDETAKRRRRRGGGGRSRLTRTQFPHPPTSDRTWGATTPTFSPQIMLSARPLDPNRMSATFFKRRFVVRGPQRDDPFHPSFLHSPSSLPRPYSCRRAGSLAAGRWQKSIKEQLDPA